MAQVSTEEAPGPPGEPAARPPSRRGKRWPKVLIVLAVVLIAVSAATARLFIWPDQGMPARVSAIVMLDSPGNELNAAVRLARQHRAAFLVLSLGTPDSGPRCVRPVPGVKVICFNPSPPTTQGEAEYVGRLARRYDWQSITIVTITPQATRARLRFGRCFAGPVYVVTTPIAPTSWPYEIAYEWGALVKALAFQRGC
jgi:hypothetical protein